MDGAFVVCLLDSLAGKGTGFTPEAEHIASVELQDFLWVGSICDELAGQGAAVAYDFQFHVFLPYEKRPLPVAAPTVPRRSHSFITGACGFRLFYLWKRAPSSPEHGAPLWTDPLGTTRPSGVCFGSGINLRLLLEVVKVGQDGFRTFLCQGHLEWG